VQLVFAAKYRRRVFDACAIDVLRGIFAEVCSDAQTTLVEVDGEDDHVHLLVEYPPAAQRPSASSANTSSSREHQTDIHDSFAVGAILPRPEGRGLPRALVNR